MSWECRCRRTALPILSNSSRTALARYVALIAGLGIKPLE
jgi:hypothetical protein